MTMRPLVRLIRSIVFVTILIPAPGADAQSPAFAGSVPAAAAGGSINLSLADAIARGQQFNLGVIEAGQASVEARASRLRALSALLPTIDARAAEVSQTLSLKEIGLTLPGLPRTSGPFVFTDARVSATQSIYSAELRTAYRARSAAEDAATLSERDARDVVVQAVGTAYFEVLASAARVETARAELRTAVEVDRLAADRVASEVAPEIDSLRAQAERQAAEQTLLAATHDLDKDKLTLGRLIGLAPAQDFAVTDTMAYRPLVGVTEAASTDAALAHRADLASAAARVTAADLSARAVRAQAQPTIGASANVGLGGELSRPDRVFTVAAAVAIPLYTGGRIRAEAADADADLARRRAEFEDLKARVVYDVRVAWLDLTSADAGVAVAQKRRDVAARALTQAEDRYASGVTNSLELVEAQDALVRADDNLIASTYAFNVAKLALARASGQADVHAKEWFIS
jgi:outer membrane protein TolC